LGPRRTHQRRPYRSIGQRAFDGPCSKLHRDVWDMGPAGWSFHSGTHTLHLQMGLNERWGRRCWDCPQSINDAVEKLSSPGAALGCPPTCSAAEKQQQNGKGRPRNKHDLSTLNQAVKEPHFSGVAAATTAGGAPRPPMTASPAPHPAPAATQNSNGTMVEAGSALPPWKDQ